MRWANKTTLAGTVCVLVGAFWQSIQSFLQLTERQVELIALGVLAMTGRDTLEKMLSLLRVLVHEERAKPDVLVVTDRPPPG